MQQQIRLLQIIAGSPRGGAEEFFTRLVIALHKRGINQTVVIRRNAARAARLAAHGIVCHQLQFGNRWFDLPTHLAIRNIIKSFQPNIVLSWMNRATHFIAPCAKRKNFTWAARLGGYYNMKYYRACDYLIGNTQDIVDYLIRENFSAARALYLPNFASVEQQPAITRAMFDTPTDAPLFLALGRLHPNKAFDTLLNALALVPSGYLWLAGEGDDRAQLAQLAAQLNIADRVRFLGWRDDTPALYASVDYFICPSRHEPLGNVVLEAMAHGLPIIATTSQGPTMLLTHNKTGLLVEIDDAPLMAAAMQELCSSTAKAQELGQAAREYYNDNYSEDSVCQKYIAAFEQMMERA